MEDLDFDSELLANMKKRLGSTINNLMKVVLKTGKEAEITLKINLSTSEKENETETWTEPRIEYNLTEKIKETKDSHKEILGLNYAVDIDGDGQVIVGNREEE